MDNIWQLQEAKSRFSEVVERAVNHGPQTITRRGRKTVVILPIEEYERLTRGSENLAQFLLNSPLAGSELSIDRLDDLPRFLDIEP